MKVFSTFINIKKILLNIINNQCGKKCEYVVIYKTIAMFALIIVVLFLRKIVIFLILF